MNKYIKSGVLLLMTAAVLLMCLSGAIADTISSGGGVVLVYNSATTAAPSLTSVVAQQESTNVNGWYKVKEANGYVRASDITVHETSAPTAAPTATPSATPSPGPTVPGVTPTPGPLIVPETDTSFEGQVISFKVPTGGLWLYDQIDGSAVLSIAAGTTIILNKQEGTTWYTTHYNGRTYFIPESLTNYAPTETIRPQDINSITLTQQVTLYTGYNQSTRTLSGITTHVLEAGTRVNVKHVHQYFDSGNKRDVYSHVINGTTYYFLDANDMPKSSGSIVVDNDGTAIILHITVQPVVNLYRSKTNLLDDFINLPNTLTLRGQRMDDEFYRVEYKNELFYVKISDIGGADVLEIVSGGNAATQNTHQITAGVDGAKLYSTRTMANGLPSDWSGIKLDPGQTVLASPYDANWYTYVKNVGGVDKVFYLYAKELGNATATDKINSAKILLDESTELYDTMRANAGATTIQLPLAYYTVQVVDSNWYSIIYDGQTFYIKQGDVVTRVSLTITAAHWALTIPNGVANPANAVVSATLVGNNYQFAYAGVPYLLATADYDGAAASVLTPIATTGENKTYFVTIGMQPALLYLDAA
ncbi:MAG: hypothetical protein FWG37_00270, partial [Clostridia bacterium]|nr:hypothetical protein [Clostridia bacterium]